MTGRRVGRFELIRKLGQGGMGSVWLARDGSLGRLVAAKEILLPEAPSKAEMAAVRARVIREAQAAAGLRHPNIVTVHEFIEQDRVPWIIMEHVEGSSLLERIGAGPLTELHVAEIGLSVLDALSAVHAARVTHRDVKPANILIRAKKQPGEPLGSRICLVDFGIAAIEGHERLTRSGLVVGTMGFMAPERFAGEIGPASDLWSLGATLYQAIEGNLPFVRESEAAIIHAILYEDPDPTERARLLAPVLSGLLRKDKGHRLDAVRTSDLLKRIVASYRISQVPRGRVPGGRTHASPDRQHEERPAPRAERPAPRAEHPAPRVEQPVSRIGPAPRAERAAPVTTGRPTGFGEIAEREPAEVAAMLVELGARAAAQILDGMVEQSAAAVVAAMPDPFVAEVLGRAQPDAAVAVLLRLPHARVANILLLLDPTAARAVVSLFDPADQTVFDLFSAMPERQAGRMLDLMPTAAAGGLLDRLSRARMAAVLSELAPRRAAALLDLVPGTAEAAAAVLRSISADRVGGVLDQMNPERAAQILLAEPARTTWLLGRMGRPERLQVINKMNG